MERRKSSHRDFHVLLKHRHYFGVEPLKLRAAAARIVARVAGLAPERARVTSRQLLMDFGIDTVEGLSLVDELVAEGLLRAAPGTARRLRRRAALRGDRDSAHRRPAAARARETACDRGLRARRADQHRMGAHPARDRNDRAVRELHEPRLAAFRTLPRRRRAIAPVDAARALANGDQGGRRERDARRRSADCTRSSGCASSPSLQDLPRPFSVVFRAD